jgi:hypothetical protein
MINGKFELTDIKFEPISPLYNISDFNCGDQDLNEFLKVDSFNYKEKKLANTTLVIYQEKVIGFFSLCTDAIKLDPDEKEEYNIKNKPISEYPSVKIARLGVDINFQKKGVGSILIKLAIGLIRDRLNEHIGCRFITVDAYPDKISFYEKYNFVRNQHQKYTKKQNYISMRFDKYNEKINN